MFGGRLFHSLVCTDVKVLRLNKMCLRNAHAVHRYYKPIKSTVDWDRVLLDIGGFTSKFEMYLGVPRKLQASCQSPFFLSKVIKNAIAIQIHEHLSKTGIIDSFSVCL